MDPTLYKAAVEGNVQLMKTDVEVGCQVTPQGNTILHLAALYGHFDLAREVLAVSPALLCRQNKKNETALHVAAKEGHTEVVRLLLSGAIGEAKETLMRMTDDNGDTTLHKAVRKQHVEVVRVLVKEDPECEFPANKAGETPLFLAAESGFYDALVEILESCKTPTYAGPCHRTALHAAIIHGREAMPFTELMFFYYSYAFYRTDVFGICVQKKIYGVVVLNIESIYKLHHGSLLKNLLRFGQFGGRDFEIKREEKRMPTTENETETRWENYKGRIDNYMKVAQTHLVVATLIAAVTFTAGLTLPGGFDNNPGPNQGMALLIRKAVFKAFVVTNAISFVCSSGAVFSYIAMAAIDAFAKNLAAITLLYRLSTFWLFFALAAVMLAFVTGTYATLAHSTTTLAIVVSALSSIYFFMLFVYMSAMKYGL
ncbi:ankyrin repeat-containing protein NPR4-like [Lycium barbarum]|uniref:ankyrin repeat-containing protein NPR4-like n=1 Tax=Lycium barbarum TaxID=112863 RepID=UPI00293F2CE2|nr:ankyrin repeat-containing protein NPR4-like [Lycium barbarum]